MSIVRNNHLLAGASGALGKNVVNKQWRGRVVMANMPKKGKGRSERAGSNFILATTNRPGSISMNFVIRNAP